MASVKWDGGKYKGATEAKAHFHHNEKEQREQTREHSNKDIDRSRTHLNFSVVGRSYAERCQMYDKAIAEAATHSKRKLRADAVTCLGLCTYAPAELTDEQCPEWFGKVHGIMVDMFGVENVIDTDVHRDEIHGYYDSENGEWTMSRAHAHTNVIPRTPDGRLCCKEIYTRENCIKLNERIEEMTQRDYGIKFMTGEKKKGKKTVEQLKEESLQAAWDEEQRAIEHRHELVVKNSELHKHNEELRAENDELQCSVRRSRADAADAAADRERARQEREAAERDRAAARQERAAARAEREQAQQLAEAARQALSAAERTSSFEEYFKRKAPENYERINQTRQREREQAAQNVRNARKLGRGEELNAPQPEQQPDGGYLKGY